MKQKIKEDTILLKNVIAKRRKIYREQIEPLEEIVTVKLMKMFDLFASEAEDWTCELVESMNQKDIDRTLKRIKEYAGQRDR